MKYNEEELNSLEIIINNYEDIVRNKKLPKIIGSYNKFYSSFNTLFNTLCTEKIINVDPYGEDYTLENLDTPDSTEVPYNEEGYTISIRLSHYSSLLSYIRTANILDMNKLDSNKIDKINKLVTFMNWDRLFDPQPVEINTEALNKVLFYYQKDRGQKYVISSLKASTSDIYRYSKEIISEMEPIKIYFNEKYKIWVRKEILTEIKLPPELQGKNIKKAHDLISEKIKEYKQPLFIELIGEILKEDFTDEGDEIKKKILNILQGEGVEIKKEKVIKQETPMELLEKAIAELSKFSSQTSSILEKQTINSEMIREEKGSIIDKLLDYIKHNLLGQKRQTLYRLKIQDSPESKSVDKDVEFERIISSIKMLDKKFVELKNRESESYKELISQSEDEIQIKLHQLLSKSRYIYKNLASLNSFFKSNLSHPKGIQVELKVLLSSIEKAQTIYFEYKKDQSDGQEKSTYKPDTALKA